jgi:hypothetical protein
MACSSCKKQKNNKKIFNNIENKITDKNKPLTKKIFDFFVKIVLFFVLLALLTPLFIVGYIVALFNLVILSKGPNILPVIYFIAAKILKLNNEEDDDEDEEDDDVFDEDEYEYELENPKDIIVLK